MNKKNARATVTLMSLLALAMTLLAIYAGGVMARTVTSNCIGEACGDLVFSFDNGCHKVRNEGSRTIDVAMGPLSFRLAAGGSNVYAPLGSCPEFRGGQDRATYAQ